MPQPGREDWYHLRRVPALDMVFTDIEISRWDKDVDLRHAAHPGWPLLVARTARDGPARQQALLCLGKKKYAGNHVAAIRNRAAWSPRGSDWPMGRCELLGMVHETRDLSYLAAFFATEEINEARWHAAGYE